MKKVLKISALIAGGLVVLLVLAIVLVLLLVDPNDYKDEIARAVQDATGRELVFQGDISLSFFPWLGAEVDGVALKNAQGFEHEYMAQVDQAGVSVKVLPLLGREVVMDTLILKGVTAHLEKNADGATNWDDLADQEAGAGQQKPEQPAEPQQPSDGRAIAGLAFGGLDVSDVTVTWDDRQAGQHLRVENLSLETGAVALGEFFPVSLAFDFAAKEPQMDARVTLDAQASLDPDAKRYAVKGLTLTLTAEGPTLPRGQAEVQLTAEAEADLGEQTLLVSSWGLDTLGLELSGDARVRKLLDDPQYAGTLSLAEFSPRSLLQRLQVEPPETADPDVLQALSLDLRYQGGTDQAALDELRLALDETTVTGQAEVRRFADPYAFYTFALTVDAMDVDRYLPPKAEQEEAAAEEPAQEQGGQQAGFGLPLDVLRALGVAGTLDVGSLKASGVRMRNLHLALDAKDGVITLDPISAELYEGSFTNTTTLDARTDRPTVTTSKKVSGVKVGDLLQDATGDAPITGTANIQSALTCVLLDEQTAKETLNGDVDFTFKDGALKGVNVAKMIRDAKATLTGGSAGASEVQETDFTALTGTAIISDGLVKNNDLSMQSPLLRLNGQGTADLPTEQIDYRAVVAVAATLKGQGGAGLEELKDMPIPIRITGTFGDPKIRPDMEALAEGLGLSKAKEAAQEAAKEAMEGAKQDLGKQLQEGLGKALGGSGSKESDSSQSKDKDSGSSFKLPNPFQ
jgi:AsmA protein